MTAPWGSPQWQLLTADFLKNTGSTATDLAVTTLTVNSVAVPDANDGAALGTGALQWSDLFLAEGGVINWDNGDVTLTQSGDGLTVAGGNLIFPGTATNDAAASGIVGEHVTANVAVGSAIALTTATGKTITSISLTAGDWDLSGSVGFTGGATTTVQILRAMLSTATDTQNTTIGFITSIVPLGGAIFAQDNPIIPVGPVRVSLSGTTTYYLVAAAYFGTSTCSGFGLIRARRVR